MGLFLQPRSLHRVKVIKVKLTKCSVYSRYCSKNSTLRRKQSSLCSKHIICLYCYYDRLKCWPLSNTRCQMVKPLLCCTCMMVWSVLTKRVYRHEYCVYFIGTVSLTKTETECPPPHTVLDFERVFTKSYVKFEYHVTILFLIALQGSVYTQARWIVLTHTVYHQLLQIPFKFDGNMWIIFKVIAKKLLVYFFVYTVYTVPQ